MNDYIKELITFQKKRKINENKVLNKSDNFYKKHYDGINSLNLNLAIDFGNIIVTNSSVLWEFGLEGSTQIITSFLDNKLTIYIKSAKFNLNTNKTQSLHKMIAYLEQVYAKELKENF